MADQLPEPNSLQVPVGFSARDTISILPSGLLQTSEELHETTETQQPHSDDNQNQEPVSQPSVQSVPQINEAAFILAFLGWDSVDGTQGLAGCGACFRRLGLWMYKAKGDGEDAVPLDVASEHMEYCPWINARAQSGTGRPVEKTDKLHSGWELLAQALKVKYLRQIRSNTPIGSRAGSEAPSADEPAIDEQDEDVKRAKDREWWARIRRMRQVLNVKSPKRKQSTA